MHQLREQPQQPEQPVTQYDDAGAHADDVYTEEDVAEMVEIGEEEQLVVDETVLENASIVDHEQAGLSVDEQTVGDGNLSEDQAVASRIVEELEQGIPTETSNQDQQHEQEAESDQLTAADKEALRRCHIGKCEIGISEVDFLEQIKIVERLKVNKKYFQSLLSS